MLSFRIAIAVVIAAALAGCDSEPGPQTRRVTPVVMGTTARLVAVGEEGQLDPALSAARAEIDDVNERLSTYNPDSELSRFNAGGENTPQLGWSTMDIIGTGQVLSEKTGGAFDVTVLPLVQLWSEAGKAGRLPTEAELAEVRQRVGYQRIPVTGPTPPDAAFYWDGPAIVMMARNRKGVPYVQITLDAIAKGYAVDEALAAVRRAGCSAGLVEIGGDLRCFGRKADGSAWRVGVESPWEEGKLLMTLSPPPAGDGELAVATSGNYRRFVTIDGVRYSHIIDPRTGRPADAVPSVTVIAPTAMAADGWATALSVLGVEKGLELIEHEPGVEALLVTGQPESPRLHFSSGFKRYVVEAD